MPTFLWEGKTAQGKVIKGEIEAPSLEAVFAILARAPNSPDCEPHSGKGQRAG